MQPDRVRDLLAEAEGSRRAAQRPPPPRPGRLAASIPSDPAEIKRRIEQECPYVLPYDGTGGWRVG